MSDTRRPLKFRAWDRTTNKEGVMVGWDELQKFKVEHVFLPNALNMLEVDLMQFTGLYDKNGVEIWEGDCVEYDTEEIHCASDGCFNSDSQEGRFCTDCGMQLQNLGEKGIRVVIFNDGEYKLEYEQMQEGEKWRYFMPLNWKQKDLNVVGNKYENPGLAVVRPESKET